MTESPIPLVIVDDHPVVLEGLSNMLANFPQFIIIGKCLNALDAMKEIRQDPQPKLVLTDINLTDINGIELCRRIKSEFKSIAVIGMSTFHDPGYVTEMIKAGGNGFITKNASPDEIVKALTGAIHGEMYISPLISETKRLTFVREGAPVLTRREIEVLKLISDGLTNKEIAEKLFVSVSTVDSHRKNLLTKFQVLNTAALISAATRNGQL
ncbi:MAG: response regulator transcription factor [Flavobacteriales bacterium]|nr:response regulator transcription factor [Flavobacteriales bacterium]